MPVPCYRRDTCTYIKFINAIICAVSCCNVKKEKLYIAIVQKHCNAEKLQCNKIAETLQCRNIATQTQQDCRNIATQKHCNAETLQCNKRCNTKDKYCNIYCNTLAEHAATCCNKRCNWHCNTTSPQPAQQYYIMVITAFHCNKSTGMAQ